jgi:hypothetical protein
LHGDGNGHYFKIQLRDTKGNWQDMVTHVDFLGWRYVEFELGAGADIDLSKIEYIILYFNNIPAGKTVTCYVDDLRALPERESLRNPIIRAGGKSITFPVSLAPGDRLRCRENNQYEVITRDGTVSQTARLSASLPPLKRGINSLSFDLGEKNVRGFQVRVSTWKVYP